MDECLRNRTVNILGSEWSIEFCRLGSDRDGDCSFTDRHIRVRDNNYDDGDGPVKDFARIQRKALRHEIIHAYMAESGLAHDWVHYPFTGHDETIIDWYAIQAPRIYATFIECGCLED